MRKTQWEITDRAAIEATLLEADTLHLGMCAGGEPYVLTLNFGYADGVIYLHSSHKGKKAETLRANPKVAFCAESRSVLTPADTACKWGLNYRSVAGTGTARFLQSREDKLAGLQILMAHYTDQPPDFDPKVLAKTAVIAVDVGEMTCQWKE